MTDLNQNPEAVVHTTAIAANGTDTIHQAEAVIGGRYIAGSYVVPGFLRAQLAHPEAIDGATRTELERQIEAASQAGQGIPALHVITDMRAQMGHISQTANSLQQQVVELHNHLAAAAEQVKRLEEEGATLRAGVAAAEHLMDDARDGEDSNPEHVKAYAEAYQIACTADAQEPQA